MFLMSPVRRLWCDRRMRMGRAECLVAVIVITGALIGEKMIVVMERQIKT